MRFGDVVNQFHDQHSLADTGTTEKTNFTSLGVWPQKVNNFDTYIILIRNWTGTEASSLQWLARCANTFA